jgi:hypothetical protein
MVFYLWFICVILWFSGYILLDAVALDAVALDAVAIES